MRYNHPSYDDTGADHFVTDGPFRAYGQDTGWLGPVRERRSEAVQDAKDQANGCAAQGGYDRTMIVVEDPDAPGRCVSADTGRPVWPPSGHTHGAARWT